MNTFKLPRTEWGVGSPTFDPTKGIFQSKPGHFKEDFAFSAANWPGRDLYYPQAQDWHESGGAGNEWDFAPDSEKDKNGAYDKCLSEKAEPQVRELLSNYGPVCLIWFSSRRACGLPYRPNS